jgi:PAS domain S-box-containing protein
MKAQHRHAIAVIASLITLIALVWLTWVSPPGPPDLLQWVLYTTLLTFATTFGVPLGEGTVSLQPMMAAAAYLVMGTVPAGWSAVVAATLFGFIRSRWARELSLRQELEPGSILGLTAANVSMHTASVLVGGAVYRLTGGTVPLREVDGRSLISLVALGMAYLTTNYAMAGAFLALRGRSSLRRYRAMLPNMLMLDGGPMAFAPLVAVVHTRLGLGMFCLLGLGIVVSSLAARGLAMAQRRLERRVQELDILHTVGQALSASLDLDTVLSSIHSQVSELIPGDNFYVALYDPETAEVSFPLAIEEGQRMSWRSRSMGNGLTEYVLRTRAPLLIPRDVAQKASELGIDEVGRKALSWLGVPIMAGDEPLGVIAVQSYTSPGVYDRSHQELLTTLAGHAGAALQNAHLYAQTDEALARRVQELNSILQTVSEGIMLLDPQGQVIAVNRALAELLLLPQAELTTSLLEDRIGEQKASLISMIGYSPEDLRADLEALTRGKEHFKREEITVAGPPKRDVERTLTPVRDREGTITGWLLTFRDLTEERQLALLREELTHMLIHDLRSPLAVIRGSLDTMLLHLSEGQTDVLDHLAQLAGRGADRMLDMIDNLLDISRLESGMMPLYPDDVAAGHLLTDVASRFSPLATSVGIRLVTEVAPDLPTLHIDYELVVRLLGNLVDNALKFTPRGGTVRLSAQRAPDSAGPMVLISVTDTGRGIPEGSLHYIFQKFRQIAPAPGRHTGSGLGLPFCKLVAEAHGGWIEVHSEVDRGTTFVVALPVSPSQR